MRDQLGQLVARLAERPRPAGSEAERNARDICAAELGNLGFGVVERPFEYSTIPGRWGTPVAGVILVALGLWCSGSLIAGDVDAGMRTAVAGILIVAGVGWWLGRFGTRYLPIGRVQGVNLEAQRGVPVVWLVAHLDTKGQPVSLLIRVAGAVCCAISWVLTLLLWASSQVFDVADWALALGAFLAGISAFPLVLAWVDARSDGALDNASGVASVLDAARRLGSNVPLGVLITTAEELGLAGARAWVQGGAPAIALNCDGVDDSGPIALTVSRDEHGAIAAAITVVRLSGRLRGGARRAIPGVLVDAVAFADAGWSAATVSKGGWRSLARVHTRDDTLAGLRGRGVDDAANLLASLAGAIIARKTAASGPSTSFVQA